MSKNRSSFLKRGREARKLEKRVTKQQRREDRKRGVQIEAGQPIGSTDRPPDAAADELVKTGFARPEGGLAP